MPTPHVARRRRQAGALLVGLCLAAGTVGNAALADSGGSGSTSVEASVLVNVGMSPVNARQAAMKLNSAIDSAAQSMAQAAAAAIPSRTQVRTAATATKAFATAVDAALTEFVGKSVPVLRAAGASADNTVAGSLAALAAVARTVPGAVGLSTGAAISVASGADGTTASASLNPKVDPAIRRTISDSVHDLQPLFPLTRDTVRTVAAGMRQVVEGSFTAVARIVRASADLAVAVVKTTPSTVGAAKAVAESAVKAVATVVKAADEALDSVTGPNISVQVDAKLGINSH